MSSYEPGSAPPIEWFKRNPEFWINNPNANRDNSSALKLLLELRGIHPDLWESFLEPYWSGYYQLSDGKSSPFLKLVRRYSILGFKKDPVAVGHDYRYYCGVNRENADALYRNQQILLGGRKWLVQIEYLALRAFGWSAWNGHAKKRMEVPGYGTDKWILKQIGVTKT